MSHFDRFPTTKNLQGLMPGLEKACADISHEIIVVDNISTDGAPEYISARWKRCSSRSATFLVCGVTMRTPEGQVAVTAAVIKRSAAFITEKIDAVLGFSGNYFRLFSLSP